MNIIEASQSYEKWMAAQLPVVVKSDLKRKHEKMAESAFSFFRGTFYRWAQLWPEICPKLADAPRLLAVGDLHLENFGTWRDAEGRLAWGINDFDETHQLAYTNDLVRLAASALFAIDANALSLKCGETCDLIEQGYTKTIRGEGKAFVLGEQHHWLRDIAAEQVANPSKFWSKLDDLPGAGPQVPRGMRAVLESALPGKGLKYQLKARTAGMGSLGRPRLVALAEWHGGQIAREAKALLSSACVWLAAEVKVQGLKSKVQGQKRTRADQAGQRRRPGPEWMSQAVAGAVRAHDPFYHVAGGWVVRRLAPDCTKIEVAELTARHDEARLLEAMGAETANAHLGNRSATAAVRRDLAAQKNGWLEGAAKKMCEALLADFEQWRKQA